MRTFKTLLIAIALVASFASAETHQSPKIHGPVLISVVASNPAFGEIAEPTLAEAEAEAKALTSLDPVCFSVPQLCEARYENTTYTGFYSDGTSRILEH